MIRIHSRVKAMKRVRGLRPGTMVMHVVSDANTPELQRKELTAFVHSFDLPMTRLKGILSNPHLAKDPPHLDLWGGPAEEAEKILESRHENAPMEFKRYILGMGPSGVRPIPPDEPGNASVSEEGEKGSDDTTPGGKAQETPDTGA